ncbi:hypothetical protein [Aeromonas allosaccharophila]|nr:hypothetical protein [Aeromonas allosaccharophila]
MQNFDVVNWLMQQTAAPALPEQAMAQPGAAQTLWQVTHAG